MQKITPFLWFNTDVGAVADFYLSVFKDGTLVSTMPGPGGKPMGVTLNLNGQEFRLINGGPQFTFSEAISFMIDCDTQEEIDYYWEKLSAGGKTLQCGWLKDQYGVAWQVIPKKLGALLGDSDPIKANKAMQAMLAMEKIDIADIEKAVV